MNYFSILPAAIYMLLLGGLIGLVFRTLYLANKALMIYIDKNQVKKSE